MEEANGGAQGFSEQVLRFLERVEHRVAAATWEREAAFQLRCEAYRRAGFLKSRDIDKIYDPRYDDDPFGWTTMTFVDGELAGTVRVNVGSDEHAVLPGLQVYGDVLLPKLRARHVIVEFTRLAAKHPLSSLFPQLAYVIMRPGYMAAEHFDADFAVASPRADHIAFYRRTLGAAVWCSPRDYPGLTAKFACMCVDYRATRNRVEARYPFYKSTPAEREALFGLRKDNLERFGAAIATTPCDDELGLGAELSNCA